ncbi:31275_t:CDS:2, partial [Racocetra persica]
EEIQHIKNSTVPENTRKTIDNWVRILNNWRENVGYNYSIETIQNKPQLEQEMIEFVCGIRKLKDGEKYAPSSLHNAINCLAMYLLDNSLNINKYNLARKVAQHHDPLTTTEIQTIFAHEATSISYPQGLQYRIFMWCCLLFASQGGEHGEMHVSQFVFTSNDSLTISVPPDPEGLLGPIHNIKLYIEHRPTNFTCDYLYLKINKHSK